MLRSKQDKKKYYDKRHRAGQQQLLPFGRGVWVTDLRCWGKVLSPAQRPKSFVVEVPTGVVQRNRQHLVAVTEADEEGPASSPRQVRSPPQQLPEAPLETVSGQEQAVVTPGRPNIVYTRSGRRVLPPQRLNL